MTNTKNPLLNKLPKSVRDVDLSHDALALRIGREGFDDNARYVASSDKWYFWDGARWKLDETKEFVSHTREFLRNVADKLLLKADKEASGLEQEVVL